MKTIIDLFKNDLIEILETKFNLFDEPTVEINKTGIQSDFSSAVALMFAKKAKKQPREFANEIVEFLKQKSHYLEVEIAGPGFINVKFQDKIIFDITNNILIQKEEYGACTTQNQLINIEYVSANPTGYLHIGHARNAVVGSTLANVMKKAGYNVQTEYYINDAGNQINVLAITVFVHYLQLLGIPANLPENCYSGEAYDIVAQKIIDEFGDQFTAFAYSDTLISNHEVHEIFKTKSIGYFLNIIKDQLKLIGVEIEHWSSEKVSYENNSIEKMLNDYKDKGVTYEKDGALWLNTTKFGDDKDRVLIKNDGTYTYIVPDLATHNERIKRTKADKLINVWGGDHHGYIVRMKAGLSLFGNDPEILEILMVQMVRLIKDGKEFKMSKRMGTAVWLLDLYEMIGVDALRYMLASKPSSSHMDLDLDLIQLKNASNPVYYVQYASARCHSVLRMAKERKIDDTIINLEDVALTTSERELLITLDNFQTIIKACAKARAPQLICEYIQIIAKQFHAYYSNSKIIDEDNLNSTNTKIKIVKAVLQVLANSFALIGIELVEKM